MADPHHPPPKSLICASARGREVTLHENDAVMISSSEAVVFDRRSFGESIAIRIPYSILSSAVVDVDDAIMRHICRDTPALKLLTGAAAPHCYGTGAWTSLRPLSAHPPINPSANHD